MTAKLYAEKATECIRKAPTVAGKKRLMARQLPFEVFVTRKIAKWEARSKILKVDLVDAVGVDPIEEMNFFWNGYSRMSADRLEKSFRNLETSGQDERLDEDDRAIVQLLRAAILRALRRHREAKEILKEKVLPLDRTLFKGPLRDNWVLPAAHFEFSANLWMERPSYVPTHASPWDPEPSYRGLGEEKEIVSVERNLIQECSEHLEKVAKWESYDLDTRIGLKVTAAKDAIRKWHASHPGCE